MCLKNEFSKDEENHIGQASDDKHPMVRKMCENWPIRPNYMGSCIRHSWLFSFREQGSQKHRQSFS